jgi:integrase/recombinase XerD
MALNVYRRHGSHCPGGRTLHEMTYEADELRRSWRRCSCPIYASGTLGGKFKRKNTERTVWTDAKSVVEAWEAGRSWEGGASKASQPPDPPAPEPKPQSSRITISDAIAAFLTIREGAKIAPATLRKYRTFTKQLAAFAENRGYVMLDQFTSANIDVFYATLALGARAKGKRLGTIRAFFRFCMNREWLSKNPVTTDLKPPLGANRVTNKVPFTDEELQKILRSDGIDLVVERKV